MKSINRYRVAGPHDSGMTLIEVVIAVAIMGIVSTAAIALSITSITTAASTQRQEIAVTVANQAMERTSSQPAAVNPASGVSFLYDMRQQSKVTQDWTASLPAAGLDKTVPGWDPSATSSSIAVLPIVETQTRSGTDYITHTLIGDCYQLRTGGNCGIISSSADPDDYTTLIRVVVLVKWYAGDSCRESGCSYQTTTLIDPHNDLDWKIN